MTKKAETDTGEAPKKTAADRPDVTVAGATKALVIGKREVLVMTFPAEYADDEDAMENLRQTMLRVLGPDRFLLVFADGVEMSSVDAPAVPTGAGRDYVQPQAPDPATP